MEIEIKLRVKNFKKLKKQLTKLGAIFKEEMSNEDRYFTLKHRDFMKTKECLRIRTIPEKKISILTYKPRTTPKMKKEGFIWKKETEIQVNNEKVLSEILKRLGCIELTTVYKTRKEFELDGFVLALDDVKGIGHFLEIEKISNDVITTKKRIWGLLEKLGFDKSDIEPANYRDLVIKAENRFKGGK
ncbi:MAG: class IV adenylate cyclase [Nanoarchaeota archaeon]|nr:class IV adenylate cyclase [Nanoarchaeota archaeon]